MRITTRADLNVGLICNMKCRFCYDLDHLNLDKGPSLEVLRRRMVFLRNKGMDTIDLTGGEATARNDLIPIIRMIKEEFGVKNICLITNGFKLADKTYMKELVDAGINEFLFSVHGTSAETHDALVNSKGSFERVLKALAEADRLGVRSRVNTTVTSGNYDKVNDLAAMLSPFKIENYNLIMYNPILDAGHRVDEMAVKYSIAAPFLKETIDEHRHHFAHLYVKYIPFCFMTGYEKHVMNLLQASYVPYEWDFRQRARIRRGEIVHGIAVALGLLACMDLRSWAGRSSREVVQDAFIDFQEALHKDKPRKCSSCKFSLICSGVWRGYRRFFKTAELTPVKGEKVSTPYHFYEQNVDNV